MASMFCDIFRLAIARSTDDLFTFTLIVIFPSRPSNLFEKKIKALWAIKPRAPIVFDSAKIILVYGNVSNCCKHNPMSPFGASSTLPPSKLLTCLQKLIWFNGWYAAIIGQDFRDVKQLFVYY